MLFQLLDDLSTRIDRLEVAVEAPHMLRQIERTRPEVRGQLAQQGTPPDIQALLLQAVATGALRLVKGIPPIAGFLAGRVRDGSGSARTRCAVAGVLAYLVQPRDLIPDDAPGGYGYLDDAAVLRAGLLEYLQVRTPPQFDATEERKLMRMAVSLVPPQVEPQLEEVLGGVATMFSLLRMLPEMVAGLTLQQIVANPLQAAAPAPPPGFTPPSPPMPGDPGRWSGGVYFEGDDVIIPGGPSLINGELFIPDS